MKIILDNSFEDNSYILYYNSKGKNNFENKQFISILITSNKPFF